MQSNETDINTQLATINEKLDVILAKLEVAQCTMDRHEVPLGVMHAHVYNVETCMQRSMFAWPIRRLLGAWNFSFISAPNRISQPPVHLLE